MARLQARLVYDTTSDEYDPKKTQRGRGPCMKGAAGPEHMPLLARVQALSKNHSTAGLTSMDEIASSRSNGSLRHLPVDESQQSGIAKRQNSKKDATDDNSLPENATSSLF
jgi:hypothetical protein